MARSQRLTAGQRQRAYQLAVYPLMEEFKIGLIDKKEFQRRHLEIIHELGEQAPRKKFKTRLRGPSGYTAVRLRPGYWRIYFESVATEYTADNEAMAESTMNRLAASNQWRR